MIRQETEIERSEEASEDGNEDGRETGDERGTASGTVTADSSDATGTTDSAAEAGTDSDERPVPLDQIFGMLQNHRRRRILRTLTETAQIEIGDLAEQIAARELDKPRS